MAAIAGGAVFVSRRPAPAPIVIVLATPGPDPRAPSPTPSGIQVYVSGAVSQPGVYCLPNDCRIAQAIAAAGSALPDADLVRINLAQRVFDEQQIYVPYRLEQSTPLLPTVPAQAMDGMQQAGERLVNVNSATAAELESLPGIGPALAQRIIDYRQANGAFETVEDLLEVRGIGPSILSDIKDHVTVN